ncbi:hypothetical protein U1Q18_042107 [Sarracenia purpurea var. burkii]
MGRALVARRTTGEEVERDNVGEVRDGRAAEAHEAAMRRRRMVAVEVKTDRAKGTRVVSEEAGGAETTICASDADIVEEDQSFGAAITAAFGALVALPVLYLYLHLHRRSLDIEESPLSFLCFQPVLESNFKFKNCDRGRSGDQFADLMSTFRTPAMLRDGKNKSKKNT